MNFKSIMLAMSCIATTAAHASEPSNFLTSLTGAASSVSTLKSNYQVCLVQLNGVCPVEVVMQQESAKLLGKAISNYQSEIVNGWESVTGTAVVPEVINIFISNVLTNLNDYLLSQSATIDVPQSITTSEGTIVNTAFSFVATVSNTIDKFLRKQWVDYAALQALTTPTLPSVSNNTLLDFYKAAGIVPSYATFDMNAILPNTQLSLEQAFLDPNDVLRNSEDLASQISDAIHEWSLATQLPLSPVIINTFSATIVNGSDPMMGIDGVHGVVRSISLNTTDDSMALLTTTDVISTFNAAVRKAINTFHQASRVYVYPKELDTYLANIQLVITGVDATSIETDLGSDAALGYTSFLTSAKNIANNTLTAKGLSGVTTSEYPYLNTNITYHLNEAIHTLWSGHYDDWITTYGIDPANWDGAAVANTYFSADLGLNNTLSVAALSGVVNWFKALNGTYQSGTGIEDIDEKFDATVSLYQNYVMTIPQPSYLSALTLADLSRTTAEVAASIYSMIAKLQRKAGSTPTTT